MTSIDLFSKGQNQEKTESSLTGLISWNVLEAAREKKGPFKQDLNQSHVLHLIGRILAQTQKPLYSVMYSLKEI